LSIVEYHCTTLILIFFAGLQYILRQTTQVILVWIA
jgi:hypothetical protein